MTAGLLVQYGHMEPDKLFKYAIDKNASDLHLLVGYKPVLRISGKLYDLEKEAVVTEEMMEKFVAGIISEDQVRRFRAEKELDVAYALDHTRFRINLHWERGYMGMAARTIPQDIPTMDQLGIPEVVREFTDLSNGLVLVTGPTGAGKSTTLASMIEYINQSRRENIITLEDPVEFVYAPKRSIIRQRQLEVDMVTFAQGLKHLLRQDPNVVLVGEMRDLETIATTLTMAETGHLVFATLHTNSAPQTISRLVDVFPPHQQTQIRLQLALTLRGVVSQQLLPRLDGGLVPAREILVNTPAIANLVRENKVEQIKNVLQTSVKFGMQTLEQDLRRLVKEGAISEETEKMYSTRGVDI